MLRLLTQPPGGFTNGLALPLSGNILVNSKAGHAAFASSGMNLPANIALYRTRVLRVSYGALGTRR